MAHLVPWRFWTVPNVLSLSRLALLPPWWWFMSNPDPVWWWGGGAIMVFGVVSDVLDGYIARRWNLATEWGRILDPLGDKVSAGVIGVFCVIHRDLPITAFAIMMGRDLLLLAAGLLLYRRSGDIPSSLDIGRYAALTWAVVLLLYSFEIQPYGRWLLWPVVVFYTLAGVAYLAGRGGKLLGKS